MRCNYNLDTQQSAITSTTTMDQGGRLGGGLGFLVTSVSLYIGRQPGGGGDGGWRIISIIYKVFFYLFSFSLTIFIIRHTFLSFLCFFALLLKIPKRKGAYERCVFMGRSRHLSFYVCTCLHMIQFIAGLNFFSSFLLFSFRFFFLIVI